jgi:hypothetical protein
LYEFESCYTYDSAYDETYPKTIKHTFILSLFNLIH